MMLDTSDAYLFLCCWQCNELDEIRSAHDRRLERLKALQTNYRLCKKQLKTLEEELNGWVY